MKTEAFKLDFCYGAYPFPARCAAPSGLCFSRLFVARRPQLPRDTQVSRLQLAPSRLIAVALARIRRSVFCPGKERKGNRGAYVWLPGAGSFNRGGRQGRRSSAVTVCSTSPLLFTCVDRRGVIWVSFFPREGLASMLP